MAAKFNHFAQLGEALHEASKQVVKKTAFDLKAQIQANIRSNGQIDTGFMVNSPYVVTSDNSDYQGGQNALPEVGAPGNDTTAYVAVAASYAIYQNYGTVHMPGRPFFEPAIDAIRPGFEAACGAIEAKMKEISGL